jgi:hypothetical protein
VTHDEGAARIRGSTPDWTGLLTNRHEQHHGVSRRRGDPPSRQNSFADVILALHRLGHIGDGGNLQVDGPGGLPLNVWRSESPQIGWLERRASQDIACRTPRHQPPHSAGPARPRSPASREPWPRGLSRRGPEISLLPDLQCCNITAMACSPIAAGHSVTTFFIAPAWALRHPGLIAAARRPWKSSSQETPERR